MKLKLKYECTKCGNKVNSRKALNSLTCSKCKGKLELKYKEYELERSMTFPIPDNMAIPTELVMPRF